MITNFRKALLLSIILTSAILFQNCSKAHFNTDYLRAYSGSSAQIVIEDGAPATNKKVVKVQLKADGSVYDHMRLSDQKDMTSAGVQWQPFQTETTYDFGTNWAQDGSKDEIKTIYAELRMGTDDNAPTTKLEGQIGLDTLAPQITGQDILASGIQGKAFSKDQRVPLNFDLQDRVAPSGYKSDLDLLGFKVGYSSSPDCSVGVTWLFDWSAPQKIVNLAWPALSPLDSFYVCALLKDKAGNTSSMLSQPMTSLWTVYAGSNNQGNGGSVTAPEVRFKMPIGLALDSKGSLYVGDQHFANVRKINSSVIDKSRSINLWAGSGHLGLVSPGTAPASPMNGPGSLTADSQDRVYFSNSNGIFRGKADPQGNVALEYIVQPCPTNTATAQVQIYNQNGEEFLLVASVCDQLADSPSTTYSYIYKIPLTDLEGLAAPLKTSTLTSKYIFVGNGRIPPSSYALTRTHIMVVNDPDESNSIGIPLGLSTGPSGEIYLSTGREGSGAPIGNHSVRRLTLLADGTIQQDVLTISIGFPRKVAFVPSTAKHPSLLLVPANSGLYTLDLTEPASGKLNSIAFSPLMKSGEICLSAVGSSQNGSNAPEFYVAATARSRILHLDQDLNVIETLGRPLYSGNEPIGNLAIIGQPEGMAEDPNGNIYFFDSSSHVVRKIDVSGDHPISLVSGSPGNPLSQDLHDTPLANATYNGLSRFTTGAAYPLVGQFSPDGSSAKLYLGEGAYTRIQQLDLVTGKVNTISGSFATDAARLASVFSYMIYGMTIANIGGKPTLYTSHNCPFYGCGTTGYQYTGFLSQLDLTTQGASEQRVWGDLENVKTFYSLSTTISPTGSDPLKIPILSDSTVRVDSTGIMYTSSYGFFISPLAANGAPGPVVNIPINGNSRLSIGQFEIIEDGTSRVVIYANGENLYTFSLTADQLQGKNLTGIKPQKLCLPGTFLKSITSMMLSKNSNLMISDASNGRILKYFLRDSSGNLDLQYCQ